MTDNTCAGCMLGRECLRPSTCTRSLAAGAAGRRVARTGPRPGVRPPSSTFDEAAYIAEHLPKLLAAIIARSGEPVEKFYYRRS